MPDRTDALRALIRQRLRERGTVTLVRLRDLDPFDPDDHDDAENTDHLGRLSDPEWLARVLAVGRGRYDRNT